VITVAIIPARMGSKRLPRKNALQIEPGVSLVQQAIDCAYGSGVIDRTFVLTDDVGLRFTNAEYLGEPAADAGDDADISTAVAHAVDGLERSLGRIQYVVTLQPAVLARSALIVRQVVQAVVREDAGGAVTAARTVPWQWEVYGTQAANAWYPGPYPRSQYAGHHLAEVNAVQVATREAVAAGHRWATPLLLAELPPWAASLDIDEPADLAAARDLWPWAKPRLETWEPIIHRADTINEVIA
jgi:CMP-N-acetylneuraminic acid synthetase